MSKANDIVKLLSQGQSYKSISKELGVSLSTINYHARKLGRPPPPSPQYDLMEVIAFYENGASYKECCERFGCHGSVLSRAARRGLFTPRTQNKKLDATAYSQHSVGNRHGSVRQILRSKILEEKLIPYICSICGIDTWLGEPLTLRLDHVDGNAGNHDLANLRFLCPNCDSLQPTYGHKNRGRYGGRSSEAERRVVAAEVAISKFVDHPNFEV